LYRKTRPENFLRSKKATIWLKRLACRTMGYPPCCGGCYSLICIMPQDGTRLQ